MTQQWREISSPPKGTRPFLFCAIGCGEAVFIGRFFADGRLGYLSYTDTTGKNCNRAGGFIECNLVITYWQPLPRPPKPKEEI